MYVHWAFIDTFTPWLTCTVLLLVSLLLSNYRMSVRPLSLDCYIYSVTHMRITIVCKCRCYSPPIACLCVHWAFIATLTTWLTCTLLFLVSSLLLSNHIACMSVHWACIATFTPWLTCALLVLVSLLLSYYSMSVRLLSFHCYIYSVTLMHIAIISVIVATLQL